MSLLTKSTDWKYEKEYRLITPGHIGLAYYEPISLTGIIVGYKMSLTVREEVKNFVKLLKYPPNLYRTELNKRGYNYDVEPLE